MAFFLGRRDHSNLRRHSNHLTMPGDAGHQPSVIPGDPAGTLARREHPLGGPAQSANQVSQARPVLGSVFADVGRLRDFLGSRGGRLLGFFRNPFGRPVVARLDLGNSLRRDWTIHDLGTIPSRRLGEETNPLRSNQSPRHRSSVRIGPPNGVVLYRHAPDSGQRGQIERSWHIAVCASSGGSNRAGSSGKLGRDRSGSGACFCRH
jgi:hypothetical protein